MANELFVGPTDRTEIEGNILHNSVSNGINVTDFFNPGIPNTNIRAKDNSIQGNQNAGLNIEPGAYIVAPRRLDATNNWWGSPSGPSGAGPGTGDAVIDPDSVSEFVPFLTVNPFPPVVKNLSTGPVQRAGTDAQTIIVQLLNDNPSTTAQIEILGFYKSGSSKLPYVHELFLLAPNNIVTKNYFVTQTDVFEFQFGLQNTTDVTISIWGVDSMGKVIAQNRLVAEELVTISVLTAGVP